MSFPLRFLASGGVLAALLFQSACTSPSPTAALPGMQDHLRARAASSITWPQPAAERDAANNQLRILLAADLTVDRAVEIALLNNRRLRATLGELGISQANLAAASRLPNPKLDFGVLWPHSAPRGPNVEFGLSAPVLDSLLLPLRRRLAAEELAQVQRRVAQAVLELTAEVKAAAIRVLAEEQTLTHLRTEATVSAASLDLAQRQHAAGNITDRALAEFSVAAGEHRVETIRAEASVTEAREALNRLLGLDSSQTSWKFAHALPGLPSSDELPESLEALALRQRLDLAAARGEVEAAQHAVTLERRARVIPGLTVGVRTERDSDGTRSTGPQLEAELPIFDQGQAALARLDAEAQRARDQADALAAEIGSEVRAAVAHLNAARAAAEFHAKVLLPERNRVMRQALLEYNAMQVSVHDLLAAKNSQQQAEREAIDARRDYWLARTELERATGTRLPVSLAVETTPSAPPPAAPGESPAPSHHSHH